MSWIGRTIRRELLLHYRRRSECVMPLLFFVMVVTLFPLVTSSNPSLLKILGGGIIWIAVLLATLLSLGDLFREDFNDGHLEQWVLSPYYLPLLILAKILAHWLMFSVPLIVTSPLIAVMFHLSSHAIVVLFVSLVLGSLALHLMGAIMAALTVGLRSGGWLLGLLLLPLTIPPLIFASHAVNRANEGLSAAAPLAFLAALLILSFVLSPLVCAFALRVGIAYD